VREPIVTAVPLGPEDRRCLLGLARLAIVARLEGRTLPIPEGSSRLRERGAAFVTLRRRSDRELRGCVGYVEPLFPLVETVARAATAAAMADGRFDPVTEAEVSSLSIEISALGPTQLIRAEEVEIGTHGLIIRWAGRSGLLLPQVAVEHGWDLTVFLEQTSRKAGLPKDAWQQPEAELLRFTAQVFGEDDQ
jgi:AmmeMemoRadiSam system protein A